MKFSENVMEVIRTTLNENEELQAITKAAMKKAVELGWSQEQWNKAKEGLMVSLFCQLVRSHPDLKEKFSKEILEEITNN